MVEKPLPTTITKEVLSPRKSYATSFLCDFIHSIAKEVTMELQIDNTLVKTLGNPKILEVTFDSMLTFKQHTKNSINKVQAKKTKTKKQKRQMQHLFS